jgi:molecular chaperone DnaJ
LKVPRLELCETCGGTGAQPGTSPSACRKCGGRGQILYQQGFLSVTRTCSACHGSGQVVMNPCHSCRGEGRIEKSRTIEVRIPPGVDDQTRLRIAGEGETGSHGGPPGDLYVVLHVKEHPFFERRNADLFCTVPINIAQAALGAELLVPTLNGKEKLPIPAGTQTGSVFRLKAKGLPNPNGGPKGDLYVQVRVATPEKLTREQKRLLEQLAETLDVENEPAPRDSSFFQKVKDIFS